MTSHEYEYFDRQVERKMKWAGDGWFSVGWDQMLTICEDKIAAGTLEKRFNPTTERLEFRAL
jgi:hypothetical protein